MNLMPFDELNTFKGMVTAYKTEPLTLLEKEQKREEILDYIGDLLILAYVYGNEQAMYDLGFVDRDPKDYIDVNKMMETINKPIADKTYVDRITEYLDDEKSDINDFIRVAETDTTRVYNTGVVDGGKASGVKGVMKKWVTMQDPRVRESHEYLQSMVVPLDEKFFTYDGDSAMAPGGFALPENNINCRCTLTLTSE